MKTFLSIQKFDENNQIQVMVDLQKQFEMDSNHDKNSQVLKGKIKTNYKYDHFTPEDVKPFNSFVEAENYVLDPGEVFHYYSGPPLNHVPEEQQLSYYLGLAASNVATQSKRYRANTMVIHPDNDHLIENMVPSDNYVEMETFVRDTAPRDAVLVLYRGKEDWDQPLVYADGYGLILNNRVSSVRKYGKFVLL